MKKNYPENLSLWQKRSISIHLSHKRSHFLLLSLRYETEVVKLRKQKDGEITKLRSNLRKCQNELTEAIHCLANSAQHHGLSGAGNETCILTCVFNLLFLITA